MHFAAYLGPIQRIPKQTPFTTCFRSSLRTRRYINLFVFPPRVQFANTTIMSKFAVCFTFAVLSVCLVLCRASEFDRDEGSLPVTFPVLSFFALMIDLFQVRCWWGPRGPIRSAAATPSPAATFRSASERKIATSTARGSSRRGAFAGIKLAFVNGTLDSPVGKCGSVVLKIANNKRENVS